MRALTPRETIMVAVAVLLAVAIPLYIGVFAPELGRLSLLNRRIESQSRRLATVEAAAGRLHTVQREHDAVAARLQAVERDIPAGINVSGLMGRISTAIAASGVQLIEVAFPAGTQPIPSATAPVQELLLTIRLRGTFAHVVTFLQQLEASPPVAAEQSLTLSGGGAPAAGTANLEVTLNLKAFALH